MANACLLLWILSLSAPLDLSACFQHKLNGVKLYEIVRPKRLHSLNKRTVESSRPEVLNYGMTLQGKDLELNLERNEVVNRTFLLAFSNILTNEYSETYYTDDGAPVTSTPEALDHCYYQGSIVNDSESMVTVSTCDGLRGYFQTAEQRFLIEPMTEDKDGDHAVLKFDDVHDKPMTCGVTNTSWDLEYPPKTSKSRSRGARPSLLQQQKYVELYLVADNREYIHMERDKSELRKRLFEMINFVNGVYRPLNTFIALTGLEVWTDSDKISVTSPAGATLDSFTNWRNSDLRKRKHHDNAQLITNIDFDDKKVGLANIGALCSDKSTGVIKDHSGSAIAVGATLAHEMGHNLGMQHDDTSFCNCPESSCIMEAALSYSIPKKFSSCSSNGFSDFLNNRNTECILNKPDYRTLESEPVCGNGFQERGEQCDCGTLEECTNPCCNATTCRFMEGAQCAAGECCGSCKFMAPSRECRPKHSDCDLAEHCTGQSAECPEDVFAVNGLPCQNGKGYCYNGQCPQREDQCVRMWGLTARVASDWCYNNNKKGKWDYGYCEWLKNGQYLPCQNKDIKCGRLFCHDGNGHPHYGQSVSIGDCKATFYSDPDGDLGRVDTGTKCGEEMVCHQNQCVDLETAYRAVNCSAKCPGHGVCNHRSQCQCKPGWLPPHCDTQDQSQFSIEGVVVILVILSFLCRIIVFGGCVFLQKRRQNTPYISGHRSQPASKPVLGHQQLKTRKPNPQMVQRPKAPPPPPPAAPPAGGERE